MAAAMALRSVISSRIPMVIIVGATGTGKTKLSVELAQKYGTEIISADSMQIYKGLDVVTAKASRQERELAPHHLLDILEPHQMFTVVDFRDRALKIIENLTKQGKIPIIVGGTNYYLESIVYYILIESLDDSNELLWNKKKRKRDIDDDDVGGSEKRISESGNESRLESTKETNDVITPGTSKDVEEITKEKLQEDVDNEKRFDNEEIHAKLKAIDPTMADRLHPNNRRKVLRSIEHWLKTGRRHSEVLDEKKESEGKLRWPGDTIMLWLKCEQTVHEARLDGRVDTMLEQGLIEELLDFHEHHNMQRIRDDKPPDYTKGIFQTLGFKEFHDYLMLSEEDRTTEQGRKLLQQSIDNMKIGTKAYARRQNKQIKGRFLTHPRREITPIYELDTTDVSKWDEEVKNKAINIIESHLNGTPCEYKPLESFVDEHTKQLNVHSRNYCEICEKIIIGDKEYGIHMKSNRHKKMKKRKEDKAMKDEKNKKQSESNIV